MFRSSAFIANDNPRKEPNVKWLCSCCWSTHQVEMQRLCIRSLLNLIPVVESNSEINVEIGKRYSSFFFLHLEVDMKFETPIYWITMPLWCYLIFWCVCVVKLLLNNNSNDRKWWSDVPSTTTTTWTTLMTHYRSKVRH